MVFLKHKLKSLCFQAKELWRFIRVETCLFIAGMGLSGFLFFNPLSWTIIPLFASIFMVTGAGYAYNHLTDKEEDRINNERLNMFVTNGKGYVVVLFMFLGGVLSSLSLPPFSFLLFLASLPVIIAYSLFRVKRIFLVKNVYTGLTMGLALIIGSSARGFVDAQAILIFLAAFYFGFIGNVLGDIRGHKGDLKAGVRTLPVKIGVHPTKRIVHHMLLGFSVWTLIARSVLFYPLVPMSFLISIFLAAEKPRAARYSLLSSFLVLSGSLIMRMQAV